MLKTENEIKIRKGKILKWSQNLFLVKGIIMHHSYIHFSIPGPGLGDVGVLTDDDLTFARLLIHENKLTHLCDL